jgi:hypothetical protein
MAQKVNIGLGDKVYVGTLEAKEGERGEETSFSLSGELKQVEDADIQWRRWEAAVAAMQGLLAGGARGVNSVTYNALMYADALVEEFKKERK